MSDVDTTEDEATHTPRPDYGIEVVDALPAKPKRKGGGGQGRTSPYDKLLPQVAVHGAPAEYDDDGNVVDGTGGRFGKTTYIKV